MDKKVMHGMLMDRHKVIRGNIRNFMVMKNTDGKDISIGHARVALSNARKEQLIVELIAELVMQHNGDVKMSERAMRGFLKLTEPAARKH